MNAVILFTYKYLRLTFEIWCTKLATRLKPRRQGLLVASHI